MFTRIYVWVKCESIFRDNTMWNLIINVYSVVHLCCQWKCLLIFFSPWQRSPHVHWNWKLHILALSLLLGSQQHHPHRFWLQEGIHLLGGLNPAKWSKDQQNAPQWEWPQGTTGFSCYDCMTYGALCHFTRDSLALLCLLSVKLVSNNLSLLCLAVFFFFFY